MGYIKLWRSFTEWEWYDDLKTKTLFLHLCITANFEDKRWQGVEVKRGQRIVSLARLAKETSLSVQSVRTGLKRLQSTGEITCEKTRGATLVTVLNYGRFQDSDREKAPAFGRGDNTSLTKEKQGDSIHSTTTKESNKLIERIEGKEDETEGIVARYNTLCKSYPKVRTVSRSRREAIEARLKEGYGPGDFGTLFEKAENSGFLKGNNSRGWRATFDWLINENNMAKTMDGNYDDVKTGSYSSIDMELIEKRMERVPQYKRRQ